MLLSPAGQWCVYMLLFPAGQLCVYMLLFWAGQSLCTCCFELVSHCVHVVVLSWSVIVFMLLFWAGQSCVYMLLCFQLVSHNSKAVAEKSERICSQKWTNVDHRPPFVVGEEVRPDISCVISVKRNSDYFCGWRRGKVWHNQQYMYSATLLLVLGETVIIFVVGDEVRSDITSSTCTVQHCY